LRRGEEIQYFPSASGVGGDEAVGAAEEVRKRKGRRAAYEFERRILVGSEVDFTELGLGGRYMKGNGFNE
jgi:hypothetical protein